MTRDWLSATQVCFLGRETGVDRKLLTEHDAWICRSVVVGANDLAQDRPYISYSELYRHMSHPRVEHFVAAKKLRYLKGTQRVVQVCGGGFTIRMQRCLCGQRLGRMSKSPKVDEPRCDLCRI